MSQWPSSSKTLGDDVSLPIAGILDRALQGNDITVSDAEVLFRTCEHDLQAVLRAADALRENAVGKEVTFVINRNINFTNVCHMGCRFCAFAKRRDDPLAETLSLETIVRRAREAAEEGATEVCLQGGINPDMEAERYKAIVVAIKSALPHVHIHAFSPFEIWHAARLLSRSLSDYLTELRECGLGSIPGTAAEILDTRVRRRLTSKKLGTHQWIEVITTAHAVGLPTTATIMYGHIDGPEDWAKHLGIIREIQRRTGGFTEFVPLGFVHFGTPLYLEDDDVRPGPSRRENLLMHAVARIFFSGSIRNIQASWVKLGPAMVREVLGAGVNDLGGTLMDENISRSAGAIHGERMTPGEMVTLIRSAGRTPTQRDTLYRRIVGPGVVVETEGRGDAAAAPAFVQPSY